jgi:hypothetical protein
MGRGEQGDRVLGRDRELLADVAEQFADHRLDPGEAFVLVRRVLLPDRRLPGRVQHQLLVDEDQLGILAGAALQDVQGRREQVVDRVGRVAGQLGDPLQGGVLLLDLVLEQGQDQVVLAAEVGVERAAGEAGDVADLLDRGADDAAGGEHLDRGRHQLLLRLGAPGGRLRSRIGPVGFGRVGHG